MPSKMSPERTSQFPAKQTLDDAEDAAKNLHRSRQRARLVCATRWWNTTHSPYTMYP